MYKIFVYSLASLAIASGCKKRTFGENSNGSKSDVQQAPLNEDILKTRKFDAITPTGERIMASALSWLKGQELGNNPYIYAQPAQCANNVSKVLSNIGITQYNSPLLDDIVRAVRNAGGRVIQLPKSKEGIRNSLNSLFGGRLPVGTFISGCLNPDCSGNAGDGHISIIGDKDNQGRWQLYHNNWYRPDNDPNGAWQPYMIPLDWFKSGLKRKWMPTPWIEVDRRTDGTNKISDFNVTLPVIDDLDPTNYYVTISIMPELVNEMLANKGKSTDGEGNVTPLVFNSSAPVSPSTSEPSRRCSRVKVQDPTDTYANVRKGAGIQNAILCKAPNGTQMDVLSNDGDWSYLDLKTLRCPNANGRGYIKSSLLIPDCN